MRTIIVHDHIFKNAGSSADRLLHMAFGNDWATLEGPTPTSLLRPDELATFVDDRPEIVAVSSHLLRHRSVRASAGPTATSTAERRLINKPTTDEVAH